MSRELGGGEKVCAEMVGTLTGASLTMRRTLIGGKRWPDDYTVIWRGLPIGRIVLVPGLPSHVPQWRWTCNFYGKPGGGPVPVDHKKSRHPQPPAYCNACCVS
jgi:hypothetical protein